MSSRAFRLKRLFEYASFPDLLKIPFDEVREEIVKMDLQGLRTGETRREFLKRLRGCISISNGWIHALENVCRLNERIGNPATE